MLRNIYCSGIVHFFTLQFLTKQIFILFILYLNFGKTIILFLP